jgi:ribose 5-phosphate isomerase B
MIIYIGADHGGYKLKEHIKLWLQEWHLKFEDVGADNFIPEDDYTDYAWSVGQKVGRSSENLGILICRSGQGSCIVANKCKHIRAAVAWNEKSAHAAKNDDNANVLCLPADYVTLETAKLIIDTFVHAKFDKTTARYVRRVEKVNKIDINL